MTRRRCVHQLYSSNTAQCELLQTATITRRPRSFVVYDPHAPPPPERGNIQGHSRRTGQGRPIGPLIPTGESNTIWCDSLPLHASGRRYKGAVPRFSICILVRPTICLDGTTLHLPGWRFPSLEPQARCAPIVGPGYRIDLWKRQRGGPSPPRPCRVVENAKTDRPSRTCRTSAAAPRSRAPRSRGLGSHGPRRAAAPDGPCRRPRAPPRRTPRFGS